VRTGLHERLVRVANGIGAAIFALLFASLILQVVSRFVFDAPAAWTEEIATIAFVWVLFWGAAFTTPLSTHVALDLLESRFGPRTRRVLHAVGLAVLAGCFLWALPGITDYLRFMLRERTPVLDVPFGAVYAVFLAFVLMVALRALAEILRPTPPSPLDAPHES
jgi:TRAP-type C4-dicarboxylate transport system permease small subunit